MLVHINNKVYRSNSTLDTADKLLGFLVDNGILTDTSEVSRVKDNGFSAIVYDLNNSPLVKVTITFY